MKATSRPFKSKYDSGRCPLCKRRISKDDLIQRLEKTVTWIESKRLIPHGGGRFFTDQKTANHAHAKCLEERNDDDNNG